jgi:hypothetical protein
MSEIFAVQLTAVATAALAVFAVVTAILAWLAFRKQAREVAAIERQVSDQKEVTAQQAELLKVQSDQLAEDRKVNAEQIGVLTLQAEELRQVSADRDREALERRRAQAVQVYMWLTPTDAKNQLVAYVRNTSQQPIYNVAFHGMPESAQAEVSLKPVMPGEEISHTYSPTPPATPRKTRTRYVTFRDRAGVFWRTYSGGLLEETRGPKPRP